MEDLVYRELIGGITHPAGKLEIVLVQTPRDAVIALEGSMPSSFSLNDVRKLKLLMAEAERRMLLCFDERLKASNGVLF